MDKVSGLEAIATKKPRKNISLGRIAFATLGYGLVGSFFNEPEIVAPVMAAVGCAASIYDEVKQKGLDLSYPAMGIFVGGVLGSFFDTDIPCFHNAVIYSGAVIGGAVGSYKSFLTRRKNNNSPVAL